MRAQEIGARLTAAGVCSTGASGWRLVYREFEDGGSIPDTQVLVRLSGGGEGEGNADLDRPSFQVVIRGGREVSSGLETKVEAVVSALHLYDGTLNGWVYPDIQRQGDVLYLGRDQNQRPMYAVNFEALRSRSS